MLLSLLLAKQSKVLANKRVGFMTKEKSITVANWGDAPNNRWSFQHMQTLFPTARLRRGESSPMHFLNVGRDIQNLKFERSNGDTSTVKEMIDDSFTDSFMVIKAGDIISEQYFNNMTVDSHHLMNSVTKSFVGMLVGIAVDKGVLNTDALVTDYLPELNNSAWEGATLRHLLDMTAGANYQEEYTEAETDFWQEAAVVGWRPGLVDANTPASLFEYAKSLQGQDQENGSKFHYRTVTTNVIGMVLEKVMGDNLGELLSNEIWTKLTPRCDANVITDKVGGLYVGAGMSACTRDLISFGMMMINDGKLNGQQVIPAQWIQDTIKGDSTSKQCYQDSDYAALGLDHYCNQVWVKDASKGVMLALGIHGQIIYMDRSKQVVMVKLSSQPESVEMELYLDAFSAMDAIAESLSS